MSQPPFAAESPLKSAWGFGWAPALPIVQAIDNRRSNGHIQDTRPKPCVGISDEVNDEQMANMPEALMNTLKRDKKPFTYTPGDVNLSEVLADKMHQRAERKKRLSMEKAAQYYRDHNDNNNDFSEDNFPTFESPKQLLVMPTYNTPLNMYSTENALEMLEVQAEMAVKDKSSNTTHNFSQSQTLPRNHTVRFNEDYEPRNATQSRAFRVLQVITDTENEQAPKGKYDKSFQDERFTGLRDSKAIPSKFFQTLQRITGTDSDDDNDDKQQNQGYTTSGPAEVRNWNNCDQQQFRPDERMSHVQQRQNVPPPHQHEQRTFVVTNQNQMNYQQSNGPILKRPAAFLPAHMLPHRYGSPTSFQKGPISPRGGTNL